MSVKLTVSAAVLLLCSVASAFTIPRAARVSTALSGNTADYPPKQIAGEFDPFLSSSPVLQK